MLLLVRGMLPLVFLLLLQAVQGTYPVDNPCTPAMIQQGRLYHAYPGDPARFIQCDQWGKAFIQDCPHGQTWDQLFETCVEGGPEGRKADLPQTSPSGKGRPRNHGHSKPSMQRFDDPPSGGNHDYSHRSMAHGKGHTSSMHGYTRMNHNSLSRTSDHGGNQDMSVNYDHYHSINYDYPPPANFYANVGNVPNPMIHLILLAAKDDDPGKPEDLSQPPAGYEHAGRQGERSNDEICTTSGQRFLPDREDLHGYYVCEGGIAYRQECQGGQVWVQPLYQCMQLEDTSTSGNEPPQEQDGMMEVTGLGDHNPCLSSDVHFHPYPGNPTQYLECQVWHRVYLWSCDVGQLWSQQMQACVEGADMTHGNGGHGGGGSGGGGGNPCHHTTSYYHPYRHDPARFIQCDQFGNMYIRKCGPNKVWDDYFKTCVGRLNMSSVTPPSDDDTDFTEHFPEFPEIDVPTDSGPIYPEGSPSFPEGSPSDYIGCPTDYVYDAVHHLCVLYGIDGAVTHAIDPAAYHTSCQNGYRYDSSIGMCVPFMAEDEIGTDPMGPHCGAGMHWNPFLHMCVPPGFLSTTDEDAYTDDHNAIYGYNDVDNPYEGAARRARDITIPDRPETRPAAPPARRPAPPTVPEIPEIPTPELYHGENPCGQGSGFYFPFPMDKRYYIQCDQMGTMFIQPCDRGEIWNQDIETCVPDLGLPSPPGSEDSDLPAETVDIHHVGGNPCPGSTHTYHPFANNDRLFIMCVGDVAYPMPCPYGAKWNDDISTCFWPTSDDEETYTDTILVP